VPKLHIVPVDETTGGFDGGVIVGAIHPNRSDAAAVRTNDIGMIDGHLGLRLARALVIEFSSNDRTLAEKVSGEAYEFERDRCGFF